MSASAVDGAGFNPGAIISDGIFYNSASMTQPQIQAFLDIKVPSCAAGAVCLESYTETTLNRASNAYCADYAGGENQSASLIIFNVAQSCGINPQALIVLLQKEQGLVTSSAPTSRAYRSATGYGCPDTSACDAAYYGFYNQVYMAARQFKIYRTLPNNFRYRAGRVNAIQWHPNAACGTSQVFIENQATAGLYNYTPYRPNTAALANMGGVGDSCSSYGNRNFYAYFTDWFGASAAPPPTVTANATIGEPEAYLLRQDIAGGLWVHPNNGSGALASSGQVGAGWGSMSPAFSAGDFNGDGFEDVLARDGSGYLWMYPRDGLGGWKPRVLVGYGWQSFTSIFGGRDFNGDGFQDVIARDGSGYLWLYPGNGSGGWLTRVQLGYGWEYMSSLFSPGDFSGDGNADVLVRDAGGLLWLYKGDGRGGWTLPRVEVGSGWESFVEVTAGGDFNGDGSNDVLARNATGSLLLYRGNGASGWKLPAVTVSTGWLTDTRVFAVGGFVGAATPTPTPTPTPTSTTPPVGTPSASIGDFTGDGLRDVLSQDTSGVVRLHPSTGSGALGTAVTTTINEPASTQLIVAGDFNGDGFQDVFARTASGDLYLYPGSGAGSWGARVFVGFGWQGFTSLTAAGDFNGDGFADLLARDAAGNLLLYRGNGVGGWLSRIELGFGWQGFTSVFAAGDFSGDGFGDVIVRDTAGALWMYKGNGAGGWILPRVEIGFGFQVFESVTSAGDLSGDGKVDVYAQGGGSVWLYKGSGSGGWVLPPIKVGASWINYRWVG